MRPPRLIDHRYYPFIIEEILSHAPRETTLAFRQTSKHYRDLIDTQLARHLILGTEDTLESKDGILRLYPLSGDATNRHRQQSLLRHAKVLDIDAYTSCLPGQLWWYLGRYLPYLDFAYIRFDARLLPAHTVIAGSTALSFTFSTPTTEIPRMVLYAHPFLRYKIELEGSPPPLVRELVIIGIDGGLGSNLRVAANLSGLAAILTRIRVNSVLFVDPQFGVRRGECLFVERIQDVVCGNTMSTKGLGIGEVDLEGVSFRFLSVEDYSKTLNQEERRLILP